MNVPSLALLVVLELVLDHANDNVVGNESTLVHDLLGLATELSLLCDLRTEHVSGGLGDQLALVSGRLCIAIQVHTKWQQENISLIFGAWVPFPSHS